MKNPIQPLANDEHGVLRFKANAIVRHLIDTHPTCDMNRLACMDFTDDDRQQFAQLIGYSLSGYGELQSYVSDHAYNTAAAMAETPELTEDKARIAALEAEIAELREAANALRGPVAVLLGMHPDDLSA
jgi:hypothetical protein